MYIHHLVGVVLRPDVQPGARDTRRGAGQVGIRAAAYGIS